MAKPNMRQARGNQEIKCEYSDCVVTFSRNSDRRRHVREKHGSPIYCRISGCKWATRRMGRLRAHLNNVHHLEANINLTLPSEFRTATTQSLGSFSNHFSTQYVNENPNLVPTPPPIYIDYPFRPQTHQSQPDPSEFSGAFDGTEAAQPEYHSTSGSSVVLKTHVQAAPYRVRVFRPCRLRARRRVPHNTAQISPTGLPPTSNSHQSRTLRD